MDRESSENPAAHSAMGSIGATQLCSAILGLLLLQGYNFQPMTTQTSQGLFRSLSPQPVFLNTGDKPSEPGRPRLLLSTTAPEVPQKASQLSLVSSKPVMLRSSTMDDHSSSLVALISSQPQKLTSGLGTRAPDGSNTTTNSSSTRGEAPLNATPSSVPSSPRTREDVTILPSPTSESVLTVPAFGVTSFIVIVVVVVLILSAVVSLLLAAVISLRFKCRKNKESEDPQKPGNSGLSESCSTANGDKDSITLISMKNINMNNSKGCSSAEKVL